MPRLTTYGIDHITSNTIKPVISDNQLFEFFDKLKKPPPLNANQGGLSTELIIETVNVFDSISHNLHET